jgi:hypothetical protein
VHIISQKAYGPASAVTKINSIALHWCNRPHRANSLSFEVQTKNNGNREVPEEGLRRQKLRKREETAEEKEDDKRKKTKGLSRPVLV